ncbi:unnamed protein product [Calypogeia fissa]
MALASRARNSLNDENSRPAVKLQGNVSQGPGRTGLKQQQSTTSERKILSDISNTNKSGLSFGTPKPSPRPPGLSVFQSSENLKAAGGLPQSSSQKPSARVPLRSIVNGAQPASSVARGGVKPSQKKKAEYKFNLTAEQLRQAEEWAKEDLPIEQTHFTGQDMEALREKMIEAEIEETVAMVRNFRPGGFRSFSTPTIDEVDTTIYYEDGRLKPDPRGNPFDEDMEMDMDCGFELEAPSSKADDPILSNLNHVSDDADYPCIPEVWPSLLDDIRSAPTASG